MKGDKKKGDSEESPNEKERVDEFVNEWCRLYRETSQRQVLQSIIRPSRKQHRRSNIREHIQKNNFA